MNVQRTFINGMPRDLEIEGIRARRGRHHIEGLLEIRIADKDL